MTSSQPAQVQYVYLFRWGVRYKIGKSESPQRRLLEVTDGIDVDIVHLIPSANPYQVESVLHRAFSPLCDMGEWFFLAPDDVETICRLGPTNSACDLPEVIRHQAEQSRIISFAIQARVPEDLYQALERLANRTRRTKNAELILALERYLTDEGLWPPPPP